MVDLAIEAGQSLNFAVSSYTVERAVTGIRARDVLVRRTPSRAGFFDDLDTLGKGNQDPFALALRKRGIEVLLTGPAALYWMYRHDQGRASLTFEQRGRSPYCLSKNGRIYYRDANGQAHWITPPFQGFSVPAKEARPYHGLQGYNNTRKGEMNLARFALKHGGI